MALIGNLSKSDTTGFSLRKTKQKTFMSIANGGLDDSLTKSIVRTKTGLEK